MSNKYKHQYLRNTFIACLLLWSNVVVHAQTTMDDVPMIGAEVFIEPGQTATEIDGWFRLMKENGMSVTRIRMFESYMHLPDGSWDYTLFDQAFKAGEKYDIKIYANLFPATSFTDVGGFKFPKSDENLASIANYIQHLVNHFKQFKSLYGWVPINEPGNGGIPTDSFAAKRFAQWKIDQPVSAYKSNGYPIFDFSEQRFLVDYNVWFLNWLATEIHKYDVGKPIHINNHNIFQNVAEYNFPQWRKFLTSLGGSAHASWHFGYFNRSQYTVAMSANSEILRSGAGPIPWLMTEMQGGNNTYSGGTPLCPTKEETAQWLWTTIGTGSKGGIFWCLNPRSSGIEAGEWAMLNFQDQPSDRMLAAASVSKAINQNSELFAQARVAESGISIIYCREALWVEKTQQTPGASFVGRDIGGVMKSALSYFEALSEMGVQSNLQEIGEYNFTADDYTGKAIILAQQVSIPSKYWTALENFVAKGGKLIVDGLTGYYDENAHCILRAGFSLQKLFGGNIVEYKAIDTIFKEVIENINLTAHLWQGYILKGTAQEIGHANGQTIATRNNFGRGEVIWMPSLFGLGARITDSYYLLSQLLAKELQPILSKLPISFKKIQPKMLMKTLQSGNSYVSVIINKSKEKRVVAVENRLKSTSGQIIFNNKLGILKGNVVGIHPEETMVIKWVN